jgi:hypothetical protein
MCQLRRGARCTSDEIQGRRSSEPASLNLSGLQSHCDLASFAWMMSGWWLARFRCPQCRKLFFQWYFGTKNVWATKCGNCGARPPG